MVYSCTHAMYSSDLFVLGEGIACVFHVSAVPFDSAYSALNISSLVAYPVVVQSHPLYSPGHINPCVA